MRARTVTTVRALGALSQPRRGVNLPLTGLDHRWYNHAPPVGHRSHQPARSP